MTEKMIIGQGFLSSEAMQIGNRFIDEGYIITDVQNSESLERIRNKLADLAKETLGKKSDDPKTVLSDIHNNVNPNQLNKFRLNIIQKNWD